MASTRWNLRAGKDGDDGGREATRTREAGGKKEGRRRKDCGMDISSVEGEAAAGRRRLWNFQGWKRKCRRDDWAKMGQVLACDCIMGKGSINAKRFAWAKNCWRF